MGKKVFWLMGAWIVGLAAAGAQPGNVSFSDSLFSTLSPLEKTGQLFLLPALGPWSDEKTENLIRDVQRFHPGGIIFSGISIHAIGTVIQQAQQATNVPLLIVANEHELLGGLDSLRTFPPHLILAALQNDSIARQVYRLATSHIRHLGVHLTEGMRFDSLDGGADIKIQLSQTGSTPAQVERAAARWIRSLQDQNMGVVPRFTSPSDTLGSVSGSAEIALPAQRYPFLNFPGVQLLRTDDFRFWVHENESIVPAAQSRNFIRSGIRQKMNYRGLLAAESFERGDALNAFLAGNDLVIDTHVTPRTLHDVVRASRRNKLLKLQFDQSARNLLRLKETLGVFRPDTSHLERTEVAGTDPAARALLQTAFRQSITVVKNDDAILPLRNLDFLNIWLVEIGAAPRPDFETRLRTYTTMRTVRLRTPADTALLTRMIPPNALVLAGVFTDGPLAEASLHWLRQSAFKSRTVICHFHGTTLLKKVMEFPALVAGYAPFAETLQAVAENIFGVQPGQGVLPFASASGASIEPLPRLSFSEPETASMCSETLKKIEPIVQEAIALGATPGAQVIVARHGKVVYQQNFGTLAYTGARPVTDSTVYDLASITKIGATLQAILFLYDRNLLDLNKKAAYYLPELRGTNKENMIIKDILTHQAGLWPFLPFWATTMKDNRWLPEFYATAPSPDYPWPVAENLFAHKAMKDSLWHWVLRSKVREKRPRTPYDYRYSDMGFYILHRLAEKMVQQPLEDFLAQNLYDPMGANTLGYLPRQRFSPPLIAPTEQDQVFRKSLLVGYVHDQGAAMHGGVAGHAGLFGTALDLTKLGQLWLNGGVYGDTRLYAKQAFDDFTAAPFASNRRGLGWDKPLLNDWSSPVSRFASPATFGHTGFTGTCVWVDPQFDLVYVFLSNRVHPDMNNGKLIAMNIRPRIQEIIYQSIFNFSLYNAPAGN